jgi:hypothetical protein
MLFYIEKAFMSKTGWNRRKEACKCRIIAIG